MTKEAKKTMTNSELFERLETIFKYMVGFIGMNILNPKYTMCSIPFGITVIGMVGSHSVCVIYTLFFYEQSVVMLMQSIVVSGVGIIVSL